MGANHTRQQMLFISRRLYPHIFLCVRYLAWLSGQAIHSPD